MEWEFFLFAHFPDRCLLVPFLCEGTDFFPVWCLGWYFFISFISIHAPLIITLRAMRHNTFTVCSLPTAHDGWAVAHLLLSSFISIATRKYQLSIFINDQVYFQIIKIDGHVDSHLYFAQTPYVISVSVLMFHSKQQAKKKKQQKKKT